MSFRSTSYQPRTKQITYTQCKRTRRARVDSRCCCSVRSPKAEDAEKQRRNSKASPRNRSFHHTNWICQINMRTSIKSSQMIRTGGIRRGTATMKSACLSSRSSSTKLSLKPGGIYSLIHRSILEGPQERDHLPMTLGTGSDQLLILETSMHLQQGIKKTKKNNSSSTTQMTKT